MTYTKAHSNTRSWTHWARPGILVGIVNCWAMKRPPRKFLKITELWLPGLWEARWCYWRRWNHLTWHRAHDKDMRTLTYGHLRCLVALGSIFKVNEKSSWNWAVTRSERSSRVSRGGKKRWARWRMLNSGGGLLGPEVRSVGSICLLSYSYPLLGHICAWRLREPHSLSGWWIYYVLNFMLCVAHKGLSQT